MKRTNSNVTSEQNTKLFHCSTVKKLKMHRFILDDVMPGKVLGIYSRKPRDHLVITIITTQLRPSSEN